MLATKKTDSDGGLEFRDLVRVKSNDFCIYILLKKRERESKQKEESREKKNCNNPAN